MLRSSVTEVGSVPRSARRMQILFLLSIRTPRKRDDISIRAILSRESSFRISVEEKKNPRDPTPQIILRIQRSVVLQILT